MPHVDMALLRAARLVEDLAYAIPKAREAARRAHADVDGHAADRSYKLRGGSSSMTAVEASASVRERIEGDLRQLDLVTDYLCRVPSEVLAECLRITGEDAVAPRCSGGKDQRGAVASEKVDDPWGDDICSKIPETGRELCPMHRKRRDRWRRRHELEPQEVAP